MAPRPQDRFASALEASDALQSVVKPKSRPTPRPAPPSAEAPAPLRQVTPVESPAPALVIRTSAEGPRPLESVTPAQYPGWFGPLARLVETRPRGALIGLVATACLIFGAGMALGYLIR